MNRVMVLGAAALVAGGGAGSVNAAGDASRNFSVSGFDRIAVLGSTDVKVNTSAAISVRATGDAAALDRLEISVENNVLRVGTKRWTGSWFSSRPAGKARVYVTVPMLRGADVAGSADVVIDRIETADFAGRVTGSGNVKIASLQAKSVRFEVTGSGDASATGNTQSLSVRVAGSGDVDLGQLKAVDLNISVRGSGNVDAFATQSAAISVAGSGDVRVRGGARCNSSKAGSGNIDCG
jgi:hypothetical protein